jgi:serine/threonine-protein phosphatase 2A activator
MLKSIVIDQPFFHGNHDAKEKMNSGESTPRDREALNSLPLLDRSRSHKFIKPAKKINEGQDVPRFLVSRAYVDIGIFVMQLNFSMCPRKVEIDGVQEIKTWELESPDIIFSNAVQMIQNMLERIDSITDEVPPDTGPRRFGNVSFRKWHSILESRVPDLLQDCLVASVFDNESSGETTARDELTAYLLGGFGSAQRLDYGTGHELSFLAFLGCIWKLGGFQSEIAGQSSKDISRSIVLGIIEP